MPRTSVVFPAPSSPESVTIMPPVSAGASAAPERIVASASGKYLRDMGIIVMVGWRSRKNGEPLAKVWTHLGDYIVRRGRARFHALARDIRTWGRELGFGEIGIADTELATEEAHLLAWLDAGRHGEMDYMARHGVRRARPAELVPGTMRVITARLDYLAPGARDAAATLADASKAYISRYALGRDYHKVMRRKLGRLAERIADSVGEFHYRVFTDSAPVLEVALAAQVGSGLARKAHAAADARRRLVLLSGRDLHRSAAAGHRRGERALRHL